MAWVFLAIGLVLFVEGLVWALAPGILENLLQSLRALPVGARRQVGLLGIALGAVLIWIARVLGL